MKINNKFHFFHNWTEWQIIEQGKLIDDNMKYPIGYYIEQQRYCIICQKMELRMQRSI